jgi:predicted PurR-regulated permease PerM
MLGLLQSVETGQSYGSVLIGIAVVFIVIQSLEDMLLVPKIMGKVTGLNPAIILLSLSVWGSLMGMVGMIIALPMTTLMISYYKRFVLDENKLNQEEETVEITTKKEL